MFLREAIAAYNSGFEPSRLYLEQKEKALLEAEKVKSKNQKIIFNGN